MKVKIKTWYVHGQSETYGAFFTEKEARDLNTFSLSGWGKVEEKVEEAELAVGADNQKPK